MDQILLHQGMPYLSILIFTPLVGAFPLLLVNNEVFARYWTLAVTSLTALISLQVLLGFDHASAQFQFVEQHTWIKSLNIQYIVGVDGISILLLLMTTFNMPFCVLASWSYIKTRVTSFMICLQATIRLRV